MIAVKTDIGRGYGSGHAQRSLTLVKALNDTGRYDARLVMPEYPDFFPEIIKKFYSEKIPPDSSLVIRDMRDSSVEEIDQLQKTAPVMVIDDIGPGRYSADFIIDLLPNPLHPDDDSCYYPDLFLFSVDFIRGIDNIGDKNIEKGIEAAFYPGYKPDSDYIDAVTGLLPDGISTAVLIPGEPFIYRDGINSALDISYPEILVSSRILITHFGITLYEGSLCGCRSVVIDPSEYHSSLTAMASKQINLTELGLFKNLDKREWSDVIKRVISERDHTPVRVRDIKDRIDSCLKGFIVFVDSCLESHS